MMVVTTRDFRMNQTKYLNLAKAGENIILSSRAGNFKITPVTEDDQLTSKTQLATELRNALEEVIAARKGEKELKAIEEIIHEL